MDEINPEEIERYVEKVVESVLKLEEEKLYMEKPRGIHEDIETIIKNIVKE